MMQIIGCSQCGNESNLSVSFKFTALTTCCDKCHRSNSITNEFNFCDLKCFSIWFAEVMRKGIPCWSCGATGYCAGFKSNGKCSLCKGKKYLKKSKMIGFGKKP